MCGEADIEKPKTNRILLVSIGAVFGGAEVYIDRLADLLVDGYRLIAICGHPKLARLLKSRGIDVFEIPLFSRPLIFKYLKYLAAALLLPYLIRRYRVATVHCNSCQTAYLAPIARAMGANVFITPHHLPDSKWFHAWYKATARSADAAINVSVPVNLQHQRLLPSVPAVMIPNWLPASPRLNPICTKAPQQQLLFVGRLVQSKGLPSLIDAIRSMGGRIRLLVSGEGPMRQEYEATAGNLPIRFLGYAADLRQLYSEVDALVVPSLGPEGSCLVALEAMAAGLPCILSDLPVYEEIADGGKAALLFRTGDSEDLVRAIRDFYSEPQFVAQMRHYAREMMETRYSAEAVRQKYLSLFSGEPLESDRTRLVSEP